jgi:uncharacterized integral membrane protein
MSSSSPIQPPKDKPVLTRQRVAALILTVVAIVFAAVNSQTVKVDWIVTTTKSPLILVIIVAGLLGAAVGAFVRSRRRRRSPAAEQRSDK